MKLRVLARYQNEARNINVYPGDEIEVNEALGEFLQNDSPGCFEDPTKPKDEQSPDEQPSDASKREAGAVLDEAQRLLADAHDQAAQTRATIAASGEQKPFDMPPDGTTLPIDPVPSVITGPDSGVEIVHRADAAEQQAVVEAQQQPTDADIVFTPSPAFEGQLQEDEDEEEGQKGLDTPPRDKAVKRSPKQK